MRECDEESSQNTPFIRLQFPLKGFDRDHPNKEDEILVIYLYLDPYIFTAEATDHCTMDLFKYPLDANFSQFQDNYARKKFS